MAGSGEVSFPGQLRAVRLPDVFIDQFTEMKCRYATDFHHVNSVRSRVNKIAKTVSQCFTDDPEFYRSSTPTDGESLQLHLRASPRLVVKNGTLHEPGCIPSCSL